MPRQTLQATPGNAARQSVARWSSAPEFPRWAALRFMKIRHTIALSVVLGGVTLGQSSATLAWLTMNDFG